MNFHKQCRSKSADVRSRLIRIYFFIYLHAGYLCKHFRPRLGTKFGKTHQKQLNVLSTQDAQQRLNQDGKQSLICVFTIT